MKDPKNFPLLINARGESVLDKPAFRNAMRRRRCLIPADGFYEWQAGEAAAARKRPYFVRAKRDAHGAAPPLAFAGLYETWTGPNGEELDTAAIVTTNANRTLAALHDRMPVFIPPLDFERWLDCANVEAKDAAALIRPADDALLEAYEVSTAVNRVANDAAMLVAPLSAAEAAAAVADEPPKKTREADQSAGRPGVPVLTREIARLVAGNAQVARGAMIARQIVDKLLTLPAAVTRAADPLDNPADDAVHRKAVRRDSRRAMGAARRRRVRYFIE